MLTSVVVSIVLTGSLVTSTLLTSPNVSMKGDSLAEFLAFK